MQDDRQQLIDCENRRMLFSISRIINRDRSSSLRHQHSVLSRTSSASSRKSLNEDHRKSEAARIRKENSFMLQRLQNQKSKLDVVRLQEHAKHHARLLSSICQSDHLPSAFYKAERRSKTPLLLRPNLQRSHYSQTSQNILPFQT